MSDAEKTAFLSKKRRFDDLPKEEQERLRRLYTDLQADPDHRRLFEVLRRYGEWLKTLPPGERAKLLSLPTDQRVQEIKEIQRTREAQRFKMMVDGRLGRDDMRAILQWIDQYTQAHEAELLADVPKGFRHLDDSNSDQKKRALGFMLLRNSALTSLAPEDEKKLLSMISRDANSFWLNWTRMRNDRTFCGRGFVPHCLAVCGRRSTRTCCASFSWSGSIQRNASIWRVCPVTRCCVNCRTAIGAKRAAGRVIVVPVVQDSARHLLVVICCPDRRAGSLELSRVIQKARRVQRPRGPANNATRRTSRNDLCSERKGVNALPTTHF